MKKIISLSIAFAISAASFAQSVTSNSSTAINLEGATNKRTWMISNGTASVTLGSGGSNTSDYVYFGGFNLSSIPNNALVNSLSITITRGADATVVDSAVRLVLNGSLYYTNDVTASTTPTTWPLTSAPSVYAFPSASISFLTGADLKNAGFGIAISARRTAGSPTATVNSTATLNVSYLVLAPIVLTDFTIRKNADNEVDISFATSTEENVRAIYVERSLDGRNFRTLFTIQPQGGTNVYTRYAVTDRNPLNGTSYYRISEMDNNGNMTYYTTKLINFSGNVSEFSAFYNGGDIVATITEEPGEYELTLMDMSGIVYARRYVTVINNPTYVYIEAPSRSGIYILILKGRGTSKSTRILLTR